MLHASSIGAQVCEDLRSDPVGESEPRNSIEASQKFEMLHSVALGFL